MSAAQFKQSNPFTPIFGKIPAVMAGREVIIDDMLAAFDSNGSSPDLCSIFTGARGTGKTALLTYLGDRARQAGWIVVETVAGEGMLEDLLQQAVNSASHLIPAAPKKRLKSISIAPVGSIEWEEVPSTEANWRMRVSRLLDELAKTETGIVFSVDEVNGSLDEMVQLVSTYQLFVRENRKVALLMAGLPFHVSTLLAGKTTSFLRRATKHNLGSIPSYEVKEAFRLTVEEGGKEVTTEALASAAAAINGFPFMFQLVGYRSWNAARNEKTIDKVAVKKGIEIAKEELSQKIYDVTFAELSEGDLVFLNAMSRTQSMTSRPEIAQRTGRTTNWISTYRKRLLEAGVIEEPRRGMYSFALPGFGDYLAEQEEILHS